MSLATGTRLGPYEILARIGAGGMGEVYRARDTKLKREVTLKVLPDASCSRKSHSKPEREKGWLYLDALCLFRIAMSTQRRTIGVHDWRSPMGRSHEPGSPD
jgi:serine/threonine protein kinase